MMNACPMKALSMSRIARLAALSLAALLAGCASPGGQDALVRVYDLGPAPAPSGAITGARIGQVRAAAPYDGTEMQYRLRYRDAAELMSFSQSRWAAPPAELIRKRFIRAAEPGPAAACLLELEVIEFEQVFSARDSSEASLELRVSLTLAATRLAEHNIRVARPGAGAGASQGAQAMAAAVDNAIAQVSALVGRQAGCKAR
jgi:cholesterol transport system auxiliary component